MFCVEGESIIGRIHEMLGDLQAQGRISCAEVNTVHALTMHPDVPDHFRNARSAPLIVGEGGGGIAAPATRQYRPPLRHFPS